MRGHWRNDLVSGRRRPSCEPMVRCKVGSVLVCSEALTFVLKMFLRNSEDCKRRQRLIIGQNAKHDCLPEDWLRIGWAFGNAGGTNELLFDGR
jgi:hypothetical protein